MENYLKTVNKNLESLKGIILEKCDKKINDLQEEFSNEMLSRIHIDASASKELVKLVTTYNIKKEFIECMDNEIKTRLKQIENDGHDKASETYLQNETYLKGVRASVNYHFNKELKPLNDLLSAKNVYSFKTSILDNNFQMFENLWTDVFKIDISIDAFNEIQSILSRVTKNAKITLVPNFNNAFMDLLTALCIKAQCYSIKGRRGCLNKAIKAVPTIEYKEFYSGISDSTRDILRAYTSAKKDDTFDLVDDLIRKQVGRRIALLPKKDITLY